MRCFTVLLACGWLLFTPPESWLIERAEQGLAAVKLRENPPGDPGKAEARANAIIKEVMDRLPPLEKWDFIGGFDTAEACNRSREQKGNLGLDLYLEGVRNSKAVDEERRERRKARLWYIFYMRWIIAKCVPSDAIGFKLK